MPMAIELSYSFSPAGGFNCHGDCVRLSCVARFLQTIVVISGLILNLYFGAFSTVSAYYEPRKNWQVMIWGAGLNWCQTGWENVAPT